MGVNPFVRSGADMVDNVMGEAYQIVKHVNDNLTVIGEVAEIAEDIAVVAGGLGQAAETVLTGHVAIIVAGFANFRETFAEAIIDFEIGEYFSAVESGSLRIYKRIMTAPYYEDMGDNIVPVSNSQLALMTAAAAIGAEDGDVEDVLSNVQAQLDKRPTVLQLQEEAAAGGIGCASPLFATIEDAIAHLTPAEHDLNEMEDIADEVNTANKFKGKLCINTVDNKLYYASGSAAGALWTSADGTTIINPV